MKFGKLKTLNCGKVSEFTGARWQAGHFAYELPQLLGSPRIPSDVRNVLIMVSVPCYVLSIKRLRIRADSLLQLLLLLLVA